MESAIPVNRYAGIEKPKGKRRREEETGKGRGRRGEAYNLRLKGPFERSDCPYRLDGNLEKLQASTSFPPLVLSAGWVGWGGGPDLQQDRGVTQQCCCPFITDPTSARLRLA